MLKQKQVSSFLLPTRFLLGHMIQVSGLWFQLPINFDLFFYGCTQMENAHKHQQLLLLSPQDLVLFIDVAQKISFLGQSDLLLVHSWPRTNAPPGVVWSAPPPRIQVNFNTHLRSVWSRELFPDAPWQDLRFWNNCTGLRPNTLYWFWCFSSRWLLKLIPLATKWKREEPEEPWSVTDLLYFALQNKLLQANSQGEL